MTLVRIAAGLLLLAGCVRSNYNLATQQQELTLTSDQKEIQTGRQLAKRVEKEFGLAPDQRLQDRVRTIGERLVAVSDRKDLLYHFAVVKQDEVNAFSLPGGYIYVNEGLMKKVADDNQLAAVLAHEIAHVTARHAVKRYESALGAQLVQLATITAARQGDGARGVGVALQAAQLAYARDAELEADRLAVRYVKAAGFDPMAMLTFLETLRELHKDHTQYIPRGIVRPQYAMTHPFVPDRIRTVKEELYGVADYIDYLNSPE